MLVRLKNVLDQGEAEIVVGTRLKLLGHKIRRSRKRHLMSRGFATMASFACGAGMYDTQCGAKLFKATNELDTALATRFTTGWAFDVELLARLRLLLWIQRHIELSHVVYEHPLKHWYDPGGSKVKTTDIARMAWGVMHIAYKYRLRRAIQSSDPDAQEAENDNSNATKMQS